MRHSVSNVFHDRAVEYDRFLLHQSEHASERLDRELCDLGTTNGDKSSIWFIKPEQKQSDGTFAAARLAYKSNRLLAVDLECEVLEHVVVGRRILESDSVEFNIATCFIKRNVS